MFSIDTLANCIKESIDTVAPDMLTIEDVMGMEIISLSSTETLFIHEAIIAVWNNDEQKVVTVVRR